PDTFGQLAVVQSRGRAPAVGQRLELSGQRIGGTYVAVANDLDLRAVVMLEEGGEEMTDRVAAEGGGDGTDTQPPMSRAVIAVGADLRGQRRGVPRGPPAVCREDGLGIEARVRPEREQQVAAGPRRVGPQRHGLAKCPDRRVELALVLEDVAE